MARHLSASLILGAGLVLAAGCGGEADAPATPSAEVSASTPAMENAAEAGAAESQFALGCGAPFTPDATPATLAAAFGRENVIPETIDGPEGMPLNVTAIFPKDPARRIEVFFSNEEERTGLASVTVRNAGSMWVGPGGLRLGDGVEALQAANGKPFQISGFGWDYGGYVSDWKGGKLAESGGCVVTVRMTPEAPDLPDAVLGDGVQLQSDQPDVKAAKPRVTEIGIGWAQ